MFWNTIAPVYDLFVKFYNRRVHQQLKEKVAAEIGKDDIVLECACGTGMLSEVIAKRCKSLTATDYAEKMLQKAKKNCASFTNITFEAADITSLKYPDESFDTVVAANVLHLLEEPYKALAELERVTKAGGKLIIPTYMNREEGKDSSFSQAVGKAGADFKRQFTFTSYQRFFEEAGYEGSYCFLEGRVPCALAVLKKALTLRTGQKSVD
ncbi:MAG: methyltransferase domain-containing protein [Erysipelotrichaceae bacterium]|nr:methyltransferase domain-containing protein [Erysipelotrichaceae bacterium]